MKKKLQAVLLCLTIVAGCVTPASARPLDTWYIEDRAQALYEMGLMKGTGTNSAGAPDFALEKSATRAEGVVMLVRLLGKENEALGGNYSHPFVDTPAWADPYIAYAYANKLTYGVSATEFNPSAPMAINQYATLLLRALGYSSEIDFSYLEADTIAANMGITNHIFSEDSALAAANNNSNGQEPLRAAFVTMSYNALAVSMKGGETALVTKLVNEGAIPREVPGKYGFSDIMKFDTMGRPCYKGSSAPDYGKIYSIEPKGVYGNLYYYRGTTEIIVATEYVAMLEAVGFERDVINEREVGALDDSYGNYSSYLYRHKGTGEIVEVIDGWSNAGASKGGWYFAIKVNGQFDEVELSQVAGYYDIDGTQIMFSVDPTSQQGQALTKRQVASLYNDVIRGVKGRLKYPDMAKFPSDKVVLLYYNDDGTITVTGTVSACNAYGVYSSTTYFCEFDLEEGTYTTTLI